MNPTAKEIIEETAHVFDVEQDEITGKRMFPQIVSARFAAALLLRTIPVSGSGRQRSISDVGMRLGRHDYSSVRHTIRRGAEEALSNSEFAEALVIIKRRLGVQ